MRLARGLLLAAGLSAFPMMGVVAVLLWGPADSRPRLEAAADAEYSSEPPNPSAEAPTRPRARTRPPTEKPPFRLELHPSISHPAANPPAIATPADNWVDPAEIHRNVASLQLREAFREKSGDMIGAENSRKQIAELKARLPADPVADAAGSAVRN